MIILFHVSDSAAVRDRPLELQDEDACYRLVHYIYVSSVGILCKHLKLNTCKCRYTCT